jgi:hypothetical protein
MRSESNNLKNGETTDFFGDNAPAHRSVFDQGFLNKKQRYNNGASPILS